MVWNITTVILHDRIMKHWEKVHIEMTFPPNFWLENLRSCRWNKFSFQSIKNQSRPMSSLLHTEYAITLFVGFVYIDQVFTFFFSLTVLCYKFSFTVSDAKTVLEEFPFSKYLIAVFHIESWSHREGHRFVAVFFRKITLNYLNVSSLAGVPLHSQKGYFDPLLLWIISVKSTWCDVYYQVNWIRNLVCFSTKSRFFL